ncbi:MAG: Coenzyme F420 hydrogenase/dehydrogenase, beta subunit C-terminal domain [Actinobacteria bacterium]|nr:Coenzyme F420 hydrogenase/dehydrogenase, beta subunit C-terminal domain [Actinomycetota bacterium]
MRPEILGLGAPHERDRLFTHTEGEPLSTSDRKHWKHLYEEIVATEICCSCSACIVACPHKVLELLDFDPAQTDGRSPFDNCYHGEEGCSLCAMACPRLDPDVAAIETLVYGDGIHRDPKQVEGPHLYRTLARATDERYLSRGQDGGAVGAMLGWALDSGELDGAVVAAPSETVPWLDEPKLVRSSEELIATAGSRYTYCATPLGLREAAAARCKSIAMVGVSCESSAVRQIAAAGIKRWTRNLKLVVGLMCTETFDYEAFMIGKVEQELGIPLSDIVKVNVKGKVIVTLRDGSDVNIPLKECRPFANEWCHHCPDFAAEHADLSCGGLGMEGWTMILVRSERGKDFLERAVADGVLELRAADEEQNALEIMVRLATKQRERIKPGDPHWATRWPTRQLMDEAALEEAQSTASK